MAQTDEKIKHNNDNNKFYISPTDRIDLLFALTKEQAKEEAEGKKHKKLLEQVDLFVMVALIGHRNNKTGQCNPSHELIALEIGVSVSTVQRSFKRLVASGFMTTSARSFKGLKTSSQVDIQFQKGEPWITKPADIQSSVTDRSVTDDTTIGHGCHSRSVTDDINDRSAMTDEHGELNSENEHSEANTPSAPRREGLVGGDSDDETRSNPPGGERPALEEERPETAQAKPGNDNQPVDDDSRSEGQPAPSCSHTFEGFWNAYPRKLGKDKPEAFRQWNGIVTADGVISAQIMHGLTVYKRSIGSDLTYIPYPARWLKEERWKEFAAMPSRSSKRITMAI